MTGNKAAVWRMPAEGEPHERCWMAWPSRPETRQRHLRSANAAVIMPGFDALGDAEAARILAAAFPGREVVTVPSDGISNGGGNIHCITQQQPKA